MTLSDRFGQLDIYLFDQLLRGNIRPGMKILDAGCGPGRNLYYFFREGYQLSAVDHDPYAIAEIRRLMPAVDARCEPVEALTFPAASFDVVLSSAVLHFARSEAHFRAMLHEMWRTLRPGGLLFCRLATTIGIEQHIEKIHGRHYRLADGTEWLLADAAWLARLAAECQAEPVDPLKTTVVERLRSMTTWVLRKPLPLSQLTIR